MKRRTCDVDFQSPPIKKIIKAPKSMYINYDSTGLIYLPADVDPPALIDLRTDGSTIVAGSRIPLPYRRVEWHTSVLPLGFSRWPRGMSVR